MLAVHTVPEWLTAWPEVDSWSGLTVYARIVYVHDYILRES